MNLEHLIALCQKERQRGTFPAFGFALFTREGIWEGGSQRRFDLASLTKPLGTGGLFMHLESVLPGLLGRTLGEVVDSPEPFRVLPLETLLNHTSGLSAYAPLFRRANDRRALFQELYTHLPFQNPRMGSCYSDLGYLLLGRALRSLVGVRWHEEAERLLNLACNPAPSYLPPSPGEYEQNLESQRQGEVPLVHDEHAQLLGPTCGHAGLWGSAREVAGVLRYLSLSWAPGDPRFSKKSAGDRFTIGGFDTPSPQGYTSAGVWARRAPLFGHLGFTGTSFWFSPKQCRGAVLLTNRVHLGRRVRLQELASFRPRFFTAAFTALGMGPQEGG